MIQYIQYVIGPSAAIVTQKKAGFLTSGLAP